MGLFARCLFCGCAEKNMVFLWCKEEKKQEGVNKSERETAEILPERKKVMNKFVRSLRSGKSFWTSVIALETSESG